MSKCKIHPKYKGIRPPKSTKEDCTCIEVYRDNETPEQVIKRVQRQHIRLSYGDCSCGAHLGGSGSYSSQHRAHVAAELATALRAGGWLVEGETEVEWGVRLTKDERVYCANTERGARELLKNWPPAEVVRRTRYPQRVTEWQPVENLEEE